MNRNGEILFRRGRIPPVDVDDALQYTPLSSVVPSTSEIIPLPLLLPNGAGSIFQSEAERRSSRQTLDALDREALADPNSKFVRKTLHELAAAISAPGGTEFRFKSFVTTGDPTTPKEPSTSNILKHQAIGKFGEMVMNKSNVSFKYTNSPPLTFTPIRKSVPPPSPALAYTPVTGYSPAPGYAPTTPTYSQYHSNVTRNSISSASPQAPGPHLVLPQMNGYYRPAPQFSDLAITPKQEPIQSPILPGSSQKADAVKIPPPPTTFDRSQYVKHTEIDQRFRRAKQFGQGSTSKNRKRKRSHSNAEDGETLGPGIDQRAKAESLFKGLQGFLTSIFEAEDNLSPDTSDRTSDKNAKIWMTSSLEQQSPCLATAVLLKLENSIHKVISTGLFQQVPVDDLTRIQKICESSLKQAETVDVKMGSDDSESAIEEWLARVSSVDNGLKTAKTVLRIMVGGREEKQLYPEDLLASVLNVAKNLIEGTINPMIEMRSTGESQAAFKIASAHKKVLGGLLHEVTSLFSLISRLLALEEVTEGTITTLEFIAVAVIFIENASTEKDSVLGVQKVERFRVVAMDILAKIFARYSDQRTFIFDEILTSLEKLSVNRQSARQFKLVEGGKNIQLVSALIMRLVQTSGTYQERKKKRGLVTGEDGEFSMEKEEGDEPDRGETDVIGAVNKLYTMSNPLLESAQKNAQYVVNFLVQRAMRSTKTGDQPYRVLMDIFAEDFIAVLGSPEWPGAELLLRSILGSMCTIVDGDKQPAPAKSMALDLLGLMGSAICDVVVHLRESHKNRESDCLADDRIYALTDKVLDSTIVGSGGGVGMEEDLIEWEGPFRYALEHLIENSAHDPSLQSACGYYLTIWSARICAFSDKAESQDDDEADEEVMGELARIAANLRRITLDKSWIDDDFDVAKISSAQIRQAYILTVLQMPFCTSFEHILNRLLRSVDDNQATTRSKGLKAILQLLQKDPAILKRPQVVPFILKRLRDPSPLVRDSAVDLIGKCILFRTDLEDQVYKSIIERSADAGVGVRKRSMKILKDIYLRSKKETVKVAIAEALVQRIKDSDPSVSELARKTFEEIWITPFYTYMGVEDTENQQNQTADISPRLKLVVNERVAVIIKVVQKEVMQVVLHDVIKSILHTDTKNCSVNFKVCKTMVGSMCDDLLDRQGDSDKAERQSTLQALTVFAKANPKLFKPEQLIMLQPYIENLTDQDDLHVFRSVIIIFRCALPVLSSLHSGFLSAVQQSLLKNLSRLPPLVYKTLAIISHLTTNTPVRQELREVVACLWTISGILRNTDRLVRVTISCLTNILKSKGKTIETDVEANRLVRTLHILGLFGKHCQFEDKIGMFQTAFPKWKPGTVSGLITDTIIPFCDPAAHTLVRKAALESLCHVCQTHASQFLRAEILKSFDQVFEVGKKELVNLVLLGIRTFLQSEENRSEGFAGEEKDEKKNGEPQVERLSRTANANQNDGVSTSLAQKYLRNIIQVATSTQDIYALTATEVIGSILRQGLVHPKECVPALVALETSTNVAIQAISNREHRTLHSKHETIVERGYMDGVRACYIYQRNVIGNESGATANPFSSKMHPLYEIVKSSRKVRKKLLGNMTMSVDFEPQKLDVDSSKPNHLGYSKFVIENLAFFEYGTFDELYQVVTTMERVVSGTGMTVAHSIETDIFLLKLDAGDTTERTIKPDTLKSLATGAAILYMLWECRYFLRKSYSINDNKSRDYKSGKLSAKDVNKAPSKAATWSNAAAALWKKIEEIMTDLKSDEGMMKQCKEFVDLLTVDNEFKLAAEGEDPEDLDGERALTPIHDLHEEGGIGGELGTPGKNKKRKFTPGSPEKGLMRPKKKVKAKPRKSAGKDE